MFFMRAVGAGSDAEIFGLNCWGRSSEQAEIVPRHRSLLYDCILAAVNRADQLLVNSESEDLTIRQLRIRSATI